MMDGLTLPLVSFSLQGFKKIHTALKFLTFLYAELLSLLAVPESIVPQELKMTHEEISESTNKIVSLSQIMASAELLDNIHIFF